jgi:hypothetical protein
MVPDFFTMQTVNCRSCHFDGEGEGEGEILPFTTTVYVN